MEQYGEEVKEGESRLYLVALEYDCLPSMRFGKEGLVGLIGTFREELLSLSIPDINPLYPKEAWGPTWAELKERGSMTP